MADIIVKEDGTADEDSLADAIDSAVAGDEIEIQGTWSAVETGNLSISLGGLTIKATGDAAFPGYPNLEGPATHFRFQRSATNGHTIYISGTGTNTYTFEGLDLSIGTTGTSDEVIRCDRADTTYIFKKCGIWATRSISDQDGIYTYRCDCTIEVENCMFWNFGRAGIDIQNYNAGVDVTINLDVNSSTFYNCSSDTGEASGGGIVIYHSGTNSVFNVNVFNCLLQGSGGESSDDINDYSGGGTLNFELEDSIFDTATTAWLLVDSNCDGADDGIAAHGYPDSGEYVVYQRVNCYDVDLRLKDDSTYNLPQGYHSNGTGTNTGLTMPTDDICGNTRSTPHCVGAHHAQTFSAPSEVYAVGYRTTHSESSNDSGSISVQVPSGADICVVSIVGEMDTTTKAHFFEDGELCWDDGGTNDFTHIVSSGMASGVKHVSMYYMTSDDTNWPGSGAKTLYFDLPGTSTPDHGMNYCIAFYKNVDKSSPITTTDTDHYETGQDAESCNLTINSGDMTIGAAYSESALLSLPEFSSTYYDQVSIWNSVDVKGCYTQVAERADNGELRFNTTSNLTDIYDVCYVVLKYSAPGGTTYQETVTDGMDLGETLSPLQELINSLSDGIDLGETLSAKQELVNALSDGISLTDTPTSAMTVVAALLDGFEISEVVLPQPVYRIPASAQIIQSSTTADSSSISVPTDADFAIVFITYFESPTDDLIELNWDDGGEIDFTEIEVFQGSGCGAVAAYYMTAADANWPGSGVSTLYRTHDAALNEGSNLIIAFYKDVHQTSPIIDFETASSAGDNQTVENPALSGMGIGDMAVAVAYSYDGGGSVDFAPSGYGQTSIWVNSFYNDCALNFAQELEEDVMRLENADYPSMIVVGLRAKGKPTGAQTYQETALDGFDLGETIANVQTATESIVDGLDVSENNTNMQTLINALSSGVSMGDSDLGYATLVEAVSDGAEFSDTLSNVITSPQGISDGLTIGESLVASVVAIVALSSGVSLGELVTGDDVSSGIVSGIASDGLTLAENITNRMDAVNTLLESLALGESTSTIATALRAVFDGIDFSDSPSWSGITAEILTDGFVLSDGLLNALTYIASVIEGIEVSDSDSSQLIFQVVVSDNIRMAQTLSSIITAVASLSDGISLTDFPVTITAEGNISITFTLKRGKVTFLLKKGSTNFELKKSTTDFTLH